MSASETSTVSAKPTKTDATDKPVTPATAPAESQGAAPLTDQPATPAAPVAASSAAEARTAAPGKARRARLVLSRIDPWSVMKLTFLLGVAALVSIVVAVTIIWAVLWAAGVFAQIDANITSLLNANDDGGGTIDVSSYFAFSRWVGFAMAVGVVNVILMTALATVSTFLYNIATSLVGGVQVTLSEDV